MISHLVTRAISDLETNYVDAVGRRLVVRYKHKASSEKWYSVYITDYNPAFGTPYAEITYFNSLVFLWHYYFTSYKHICLKSTHPELLI